MADTTRGTGRLRAWPRTRGRGGTKVQKKNQQNFMNAQRATKYFAPQMYLWFMQQVEDSPLLPRDAMTMMLYNRLYAFTLDTGRTLWPMPAYHDVSDALDVITTTEGQTLVRGPKGWQPATAPGPSEASRFRLLFDETVSAPVEHIDVKNLNMYYEFVVMVISGTSNSGGQRCMSVSTDRGETFYTTTGDYILVPSGGNVSNRNTYPLHGDVSGGARSGVAKIVGNYSGMPPYIGDGTAGGGLRYFVGSTDPINGIRFFNYPSGEITGGRFIIVGR